MVNITEKSVNLSGSERGSGSCLNYTKSVLPSSQNLPWKQRIWLELNHLRLYQTLPGLWEGDYPSPGVTDLLLYSKGEEWGENPDFWRSVHSQGTQTDWTLRPGHETRECLPFFHTSRALQLGSRIMTAKYNQKNSMFSSLFKQNSLGKHKTTEKTRRTSEGITDSDTYSYCKQ